MHLKRQVLLRSPPQPRFNDSVKPHILPCGTGACVIDDAQRNRRLIRTAAEIGGERSLMNRRVPDLAALQTQGVRVVEAWTAPMLQSLMAYPFIMEALNAPAL